MAYIVGNMAAILGTFEQAVLLALVRPETTLGKEAYGRAILKEVELRMGHEVAAGAVYATLERLEAKGLVSSRLGPGNAIRGGRRRRHYVVEASGIRALNEAKAAVERIWACVPWPVKGTA
jgi:DNA-binding PadR family transcriptional regulator